MQNLTHLLVAGFPSVRASARRRGAGFLALSLAALWLASCRDNRVTAYQVPKENAAPAPAETAVANPEVPPGHPPIAGQPVPSTSEVPPGHPPIGGTGAAPAPGAPAGNTMAGTAVPTAAGPGLKWTAPAHWQAKAGSAMRKGSYAITGEGGATADLAITAFPGDVGGESANVNRWRGQLQLTALPDAQATASIQRLQVSGLAIGVVDIANPAGAAPMRMLGAMVPYQGATWFFKLTGPDALVAKEKPAFLEFIQTIVPSTP